MDTAFAAFTSGKRMVWRKSIDLSRTLVPSMGQHDPLDGFITCVQLRMAGRGLSAASRALVVKLDPFLPHAEAIESFWMRRRGDSGWAEHHDIDDVMLATNLEPGGFLE